MFDWYNRSVAWLVLATGVESACKKKKKKGPSWCWDKPFVKRLQCKRMWFDLSFSPEGCSLSRFLLQRKIRGQRRRGRRKQDWRDPTWLRFIEFTLRDIRLSESRADVWPPGLISQTGVRRGKLWSRAGRPWLLIFGGEYMSAAAKELYEGGNMEPFLDVRRPECGWRISTLWTLA